MNKSNKFIFSASGIIKELIFKNYQNKINLLKFPSTILTSLIFRNKLFCQTEKQVDEKNLSEIFIVKNSLIVTSIRLYFNMTILSIHLMFPDPRWIKKVSDSCASAPISPSVPATHQGIFFSLHLLCTQEISRNRHILHFFSLHTLWTQEISTNRHVLHSPGTSSVTVQTETWLKSHLSISETLRNLGRQYINLNSIFVPIFIEAFKTIKQFKHSSYQNFVFSNLLHLLSLKLVRPLFLSIINGKFKNLKRNSIGIYVLFHLNKNALILYSHVLPLNSVISDIVLNVFNNDCI